MIKQIDTLAYGNGLRDLSPMWKCAFATIMLLFTYIAHPAVQFLLAIWLTIWTVGYARIPIRFYLSLIAIACLFFIGSIPALIVEIRPWQATDSVLHEAAGFTFMNWHFFVTSSGLLLVGKLFVRIVACLSCMAFIICSTPFAELLQVLKKIRVPMLVLEIMLIMYRILFILFETAQDMYVAQQARGGQSGFQNRLKDTATLIVQMFIKTMQQYRSLSNGLVSRGFTEDIHMAPYQAKPVPVRYKAESIAGFILLLLLEIWLHWRIAL
ncbi:cobalt ECF transporter T component CbiQ [Paenibacillus alba]|uniref:Cobalt ECF transporter T component CbiQ n=1 Tax=Paenibacillus alba TaxID=1197127 RepID=A0ABU6FUG2_9BACL|nr:cobalt ECF transporter T component CbiQ [Paenibacillus alba]MEC0225529.1 cobalt ECF transporter T component CbiQ [Paenibacillus alba]